MKVLTTDPPATAPTPESVRKAISSTLEPKDSSETSPPPEVSEKAQLIRKASEAVRNQPDVRKDKVAALKKSINEGTYRLDSKAIAERLIEEHLKTDFGKNKL